MLDSLEEFSQQLRLSRAKATVLHLDATALQNAPRFRRFSGRIRLVVTSPPYPGVHVLYHRWQVDGRRETPAPYWISGCHDGEGASYYNFGDRRQGTADNYFNASLGTLKAIRGVMIEGGCIVQMVAFNNPDLQLDRYLENMEKAGFTEAGDEVARIWRQVPQRKWLANLRGKTGSSNEVVLIHRTK
jgi:hypothetical protein